MSAWQIAIAAVTVALSCFAIVYIRYPDLLFHLMLRTARRIGRLKLRTVDVGGTTWPYLVGGPTGSATLVFVHGFNADKDSWAIYARYLTKHYRVVAPDLPGFGDNTLDPERDYGVRAQAAALEGFLDALGIECCHLAGSSMGGYIAMIAALEYPERLQSLTLLDAAGLKTPGSSELEAIVARGENPFVVAEPDDVKRLVAFVTHKPVPLPGAIKRAYVDRMAGRKDHLDRTLAVINTELRRNPLNDAIRTIAMPTLALWGRHDRLIDVSAVTVLEDSISDLQSVVFEDTGHMPMVECPAQTAQHHREFLQRLEG